MRRMASTLGTRNTNPDTNPKALALALELALPIKKRLTTYFWSSMCRSDAASKGMTSVGMLLLARTTDNWGPTTSQSSSLDCRAFVARAPVPAPADS